jgi:hypothetical protein
MAAIVGDVAYVFKQVFSSKIVFLFFVGIIALRALICFLVNVLYCAFSMRAQVKAEELNEGEDIKQVEMNFKKTGFFLYFGIPMCLFTGTYRMTARK